MSEEDLELADSDTAGATNAAGATAPEPVVRGWIPLYPWWYAQERERMHRRFPQFTVSERELANGVLAYKGTISVDLGSRIERNYVLLVYHDETPFRIPYVVPLNQLPDGDEWLVDDTLFAHARRMPEGYRRHQMADARAANWAGNLCVIEAGTGDRAEAVSGVEVLRRAKAVFQAIALGRPFPFPDAEADELEGHFVRHGDIILGDAFFADDLGRAGTFWAIGTMDDWRTLPTYVEQSNDISRRLYLGLHVVQREGAISTNWRTDRTLALRRAFPFVTNGRLSFEARTTASDDFLTSSVVQGTWVRLAEEPEPVASGGELAQLLERQSGIPDGVTELLRLFPRFGDVDTDISWVGLSYPGRDGEKRWLFLGILARERVTEEIIAEAGEGVRRDVLRDAHLVVMRSHRLARTSLELRNRGTVPTTLASKSVLVLGCGALGGDVAVTLANAGVGKLILVDHDIMAPGNVIRHATGLAATGLSKTDALRQLLHQHNPFVDVESLPHSATDPRERIDELLQRADIAVSTIADENVELVINEAAVRLGRTVIYGRALRSGLAARVFRVRPQQDACKKCLALYRDGAEKGEGLRWIDVPSAQSELLARECGQPVLAGSASDLRFAADLTSRAVIDELAEGTSWNNLLWVREPWPGAPASVSAPYTAARESFAPRPECPACGRPRVKRIVLSSAAKAALKSYAEAKPKVETGGVLIGYEDSGTVHVFEVTDAGPHAEETPVRFRYDADHVNAWLKDAADRLGKRGQYVGEWHTHLEPNPRPSARDIESLTDIAAAPNFLTDEPVMIIGGVDPQTGQVEGLHASSFPINRGMRPLSLGVQ